MIDCKHFYNMLIQYGVAFFTGVPDSLLKSFCGYLAEHANPESHVIAANEGGAIALACGHYLATSRPGLVYMQNSGQGNAANPLISLADKQVYSIPVLLLIGWRGEPGKNDEPQHIKQGEITLSFLDVLGVPYWLLPDTDEKAEHCVEQAFKVMKESCAPAALIAKKETFAPYQIKDGGSCPYELTREAAIKEIVNNLDESDIIVSTTGKASRELYECRELFGGGHCKDFLTVGSMGHASQIALGIAMAKSQRNVFVLDGDGAVIMQMGSMAIIGSGVCANLKHIILNNGSHDSVGGQPTAGFSISFTGIAKACGYKNAMQAENLTEVSNKMKLLKSSQGPALLEIKVSKGARADLGRPKSLPKENKTAFMRFLAD